MKKFLILISITVFSLCAIYPEENNFAKKGNKFALSLYHQLVKNFPDINIVFSPFSTRQAIAMAYYGSNTETQKQIQKTLGFTENKDIINARYKKLNNQLVETSDSVNFAIANGLWAHKQYKFLPNYFNQISSNFSAPIKLVNFVKSKSRNKAINEINKWVSNKTNNNIPELLSTTDVSDLTRLIIANAVWFKADWLKAFDKEKTGKRNFNNLNGKTSVVEMMQQKSEFKLFENKNYQAIDLPYQGEQFSMLIFLPRETKNFLKLEKQLLQNTIEEVEKNMNKRKVHIQLPKFKTSADIELKNTLAEMGMPLAFSDSADFSGMTGNTDLKIDKIIHKAKIEVTELGAEASAATAVIMVRKSAIIREIQFNANRPFIYLIKDNNTGSYLFMGRYLKGE